MRRTTIVLLGAGAVALAGCGGGGGTFANGPRPVAPVNLTVYIGNARVSVSPSSLGAGPIVFIVTNQAGHSESLQIRSAAPLGAQVLADTGPINPQGTATVKVDVSEGDYDVGAGSGASTEAAAATAPAIQPAVIHVGRARPGRRDALLQP